MPYSSLTFWSLLDTCNSARTVTAHRQAVAALVAYATNSPVAQHRAIAASVR